MYAFGVEMRNVALLKSSKINFRRNEMGHKWTREDDALAFYLQKFGEKDAITLESVAKFMGFGEYLGSLKMRIKNFEAIHTKGKSGLDNYALQSKKIYEKYKNLDEEALYKKCVEILGRVRN